MFNIKEPEYRNEELYTRTFYPDLCEPEVEEPEVESDLRCKFCGGTKELFGLPDGTVCSNAQTKGYWMGSDEDAKHLALDLRSRGLKLLEASRKVEVTLAKGGQIGWENILHG